MRARTTTISENAGWVTLQQAAVYLSVSWRTIRRMTKDGRLFARRVGRQLRVRRSDLDLVGVTETMATSHDVITPDTDDVRPEYDFRSLSGVTRGGYAQRYRERLRVVRLAEDVAPAFADEEAVNAALREFLEWRRNRHASKPA